MRRKPSNNNFNQKRRNSQGRGGHHQPRKNYGAAREKYLAQARDALSSGDRVMAEYYYQHAEHCFRMMAEENSRNPRPQQNQNRPQDMDHADDMADESMDDDSSVEQQLPAFITSGQPVQTEDDSVAAAEGKQ